MTRLTTVVLLAALVGTLALTADARVSSGTTVKAAYNAKLKKEILVTSAGLTLYSWTPDTGGQSTCYNDAAYHCSKSWPPLLTTGAPHAGKGAVASLLGTIKRKDGKLQVTYKKWPLYTDAGSSTFGLVADKKPGDVNGVGFASLWFALTPAGKHITH